MGYTAIAVVAFGGALFVMYVQSVLRAYQSRLSDIPGPWYGLFTSLHLNYAFSSGEIWKDIEKHHAKFGSIVRLGPRQIWVADKDALKTILVKDDLPKVATYKEFSRDRHSPGIFGEIRREPHKKLKRFLSPAFTVHYIDNLEYIFAHTLRSLLSSYAKQVRADSSSVGIETDLMKDLHNVALDIMGESTFGRGFGQTGKSTANEADIDETVWAKIPESIFNGLRKRYQTVFVKRFFRNFGWEMQFEWPSQMATAIEVMMKRRMRSPGEKLEAAETRQDLLQHVIEQGRRPDNGEPMTSREIADHMAEVLIGGSETTSNQMACLFLELARNPGVRKKLLDSLPAMSIHDDHIISSKTVRSEPRYSYLEACIKENLRLNPIASELGRRTGAEWTSIGNYVLPPYTVVCASYRALHRNEEHWPQALRFWPERWLPEDERGDAPAANLDAYYPFSGGRHSCIGKNFAWAEMRTVCANILSRYEVVEVPGQKVDFKQYITMQFATGQWRVRLDPRRI